MAHAVAFAAIRTAKTREHFAESSYTTQFASTDNAQHKNYPSSASTIAWAKICLCWSYWSRSTFSLLHWMQFYLWCFVFKYYNNFTFCFVL